MKFLITISTDSELVSYEAITLGFTLASFDHQVRFYFTGDSHRVLSDEQSRIYGMVQSLELYDIACAWADFDDSIRFHAVINDVLQRIDAPPQLAEFDSILSF